MTLPIYILRIPILFLIFFAILSSATGSDFWCPMNNPLGYTMFRGQIEVNSKGYIFGMEPLKIYRSVDMGSSWQALLVSQNAQYSALGSIGDNGLILVSDEMYRSDDDGENWTVISPYPGFQGLSKFGTTSTGAIVIPSGDSIYISRDRGDTWQYKIFAVETPSGSRRSLAGVLAADNGDIYVRCNYYTEDADGSPVKMPDELYVLRKDADIWVQLPTPDIMNLVLLAVDNDGDIYIVIDNKQIGRFDAVAQSWTISAPGPGTDDVAGCRLLPDGRFYLWTARSLYQSTDKGITWQRAQSGLPRDYMLLIRDLAVGKDRTVYVSTVYHGLFMLPPQEDSWRPIGADMSEIPVSKLFVSPEGNRLFATSFFNGFHRSDDGGITWQRMSLQRQLDGTTIVNFPTWDIISATTGTLYAAAGAEGIFMSEDNGDSWSQIAYLSSSVASISFETLAVAADGSLIARCKPNNGQSYMAKSTDGGTVWTIVFEGGDRIIRGEGATLFLSHQNFIYRSSDHGDTWEQIAIPEIGVDSYIYEMIYTRDHRFFLATTEGILLSIDNGVNWSVYGLPGSVCTTLLYTTRGHVLVVADDGTDNYYLLKTEDEGKTWQDITSNLPGGITTLAEDADGWLYVGSVRLFKNCVASTVEEQTSVPSAAPSLSCFPNPASECVTVSYQLTASAHVSVKVMDLSGKEIAMLVNEWKPSGAHTCEWKYNVPKGMYLVVINSGAEPVSYPVYCQ